MSTTAPIRLGFARGVAPNTWARRWAAARPEQELELVPVDVAYGRGLAPDPGTPVDVMIERALPGLRPESPAEAPRHAMRLYTERIALVLPRDHELADETGIDVADLALVPLLGHPEHPSDWGATQPWSDPSLAPTSVAAALDLVAAGLGGILLPLQLARHLTRKREHAIVAIIGEPELPGTTVWATWAVARDADDVQQLAGVLRGRTARSGRSEPEPGDRERTDARADSKSEAKRSSGTRQNAAKSPSKKGPPPGSRGAQLAAAKRRKRR